MQLPISCMFTSISASGRPLNPQPRLCVECIIAVKGIASAGDCGEEVICGGHVCHRGMSCIFTDWKQEVTTHILLVLAAQTSCRSLVQTSNGYIASCWIILLLIVVGTILLPRYDTILECFRCRAAASNIATRRFGWVCLYDHHSRCKAAGYVNLSPACLQRDVSLTVLARSLA